MAGEPRYTLAEFRSAVLKASFHGAVAEDWWRLVISNLPAADTAPEPATAARLADMTSQRDELLREVNRLRGLLGRDADGRSTEPPALPFADAPRDKDNPARLDIRDAEHAIDILRELDQWLADQPLPIVLHAEAVEALRTALVPATDELSDLVFESPALPTRRDMPGWDQSDGISDEAEAALENVTIADLMPPEVVVRLQRVREAINAYLPGTVWDKQISLSEALDELDALLAAQTPRGTEGQ